MAREDTTGIYSISDDFNSVPHPVDKNQSIGAIDTTGKGAPVKRELAEKAVKWWLVNLAVQYNGD